MLVVSLSEVLLIIPAVIYMPRINSCISQIIVINLNTSRDAAVGDAQILCERWKKSSGK